MPDLTIAARMIDSLYTEALVLTDETRSYFEQRGLEERLVLTPAERVDFACEALKATTRLMQVVAWLLTRKAVTTGDLAEQATPSAHRRLGPAPRFEASAIAGFPPEAQRLLAAGADLYDRVGRLESGTTPPDPIDSPARSLLQRLERSL